MIRHVMMAARQPTQKNILRLFVASQYGGSTIQPGRSQLFNPKEKDVELIITAATKLTISSCGKVYKLPEHQRKTAVVDPKEFGSPFELPSGLIIPQIQPIVRKPDISAPSTENVEKLCKSDLKQRRRHMNKHKLRKLRKRMKFVYLRLAQKKLKRKALLLKKDCEDIVNSAKNWDPLEEIKNDLEIARKGGYGIDVFEKKSL